MKWTARRLKALRASFDGETQKAFADRIGVSKATIAYWETAGPIPALACNLLDRMESEQREAGKLPELQTA